MTASRKVEAPVPQYLPQVEPWGRYKEFTLAVKNNYKGRDLFDNIHPLATRELTIFEYNAKIVDQGALLKKKVTRPSPALLTWPKRFECSAFWGMMKLLEIDGKSAPGEKPLDPSAAQEVPDEPKPPKLNPDEVKDVAKQKSFRLRESIVMQAMNGPAPAGIDVKDRGGLDALIFQAANRGAQRSAHLKEESAPQAEVSSPKPRRTSAAKRDSMLSPGDMTAIAALSAQLSSASVSRGAPMTAMDGADPIYDVRMATLKYEKQTLKAKLKLAQAEVFMAQAEQEVVKARMEFAQTQAAMLEKMMAAYEEAQDKMDSMK
jgi:hypothetical protein